MTYVVVVVVIELALCERQMDNEKQIARFTPIYTTKSSEQRQDHIGKLATKSLFCLREKTPRYFQVSEESYC